MADPAELTVEATPARGRLADWASAATWSRVGLPAVIVAMILVFSFLNPNFYSATNLRNVARQTAILGITACGQTMVILSGGFDLSVGMVIGLISVAGSLAMIQLGLWPGMLAGVLMGVAVGALNGFMVARAGLPPFIATLAMFSAARGLALILSGGLPITDLPPDYRWLGAGHVLTLPLPAVIAAVAFLGCHLLMKKTRFGRYVYAIGGNEEAAVYSGVPVARYKVSVWALHGLLVGAAAVILTSRAVSGHATLGEGAELESIAATVIGGTALGRGRGSIFNTLLGVVAMGILTNGLNLINVSTYYQMVAMGVIIAGAVYVDQWRHRQR
ncbi:MAG TPA: ABC transporter permease [Methylomirabilota bacterium]|nr:ABC transporter permease [Methylomirabilota bacterium]